MKSIYASFCVAFVCLSVSAKHDEFIVQEVAISQFLGFDTASFASTEFYMAVNRAIGESPSMDEIESCILMKMHSLGSVECEDSEISICYKSIMRVSDEPVCVEFVVSKNVDFLWIGFYCLNDEYRWSHLSLSLSFSDGENGIDIHAGRAVAPPGYSMQGNALPPQGDRKL